MDRSALLTYSQDQSTIAEFLRHRTPYDPATEFMLRQVTEPGDIVCDIGANFGYFTTLLSELASEVHAFEPDPANYMLLKANCKECKNVTTYPCALSDEDGIGDLFLSDKQFGNHSLREENVSDPIASIRVRTKTLDSFDFVPRIVKCDAQGAEAKIFRAAEKTLRQDKVFIIFEFWYRGIKNMGDEPMELINLFLKQGLTLGVFVEGKIRRIGAGSEIVLGYNNSPNMMAYRGYDF